jgi:hypothetical protein
MAYLSDDGDFNEDTNPVKRNRELELLVDKLNKYAGTAESDNAHEITYLITQRLFYTIEPTLLRHSIGHS